VTDFGVGYKAWFEGEYAEIVRYDSAHQFYHRHAAGYPVPGPIADDFGNVPMNLRGSFAVNHIKSNSESWQHVLKVPIPVKTGKEETQP
jgi:hypothetical protein